MLIPLAAVSLSVEQLALLLIGAMAVPAIVLAWLAPPTVGRATAVALRWLPPLATLALLVGLLWFAIDHKPSSEPAKRHVAEALAAATILLFLTFVYWLAPKRAIATSEIVIKRAGEERSVARGAVVSKTIADRPEAQGKVVTTYVAREAFDYSAGGQAEHVEKDEQVAEEVLELPAARGKVRTVRTARRPFSYSVVETVTYRVGTTLPADVATSAAAKDKQRSARPFFLRSLIVGQDGRWSTSKLQAVLWTGALLFALLAILIAKEILGARLPELARLDLPDQYYLLLGGPFAAAILAKASTSAKVEDGTLVKLTAEDPTKNPFRGIQEVISNDEGRTDLFDFQFFAFNLIALAVFGVLLWDDLGKLPDIPQAIFGLTSASALAYSTKKSLERTVPLVVGTSSTTVSRGQEITVWGRHLAIGGVAPDVLVGGRPAQKVAVQSEGAGRNDTLAITLPLEIAGTVPLVVIPHGGQPTAATTLTVSTATIARVDPDPIVAVPGARVAITGSGFGGETGTLHLDDDPLEVVSWRPDTIVASLGPATYGTGQGVVLQVKSTSGDVGAKAVRVEAMRIDMVEPRSFKGQPGTTLTLTGSGFARSGLQAQVAGTDADVEARSDGVAVVTLRSVTAAARSAVLALTDGQGYDAKSTIEVTA